MSIRDKGTVTVRLSWESGSKTNADINNMELVYTGKYAALLAIMPAKGAVAAEGNDIPDGYKVETANLRPRKGLLGTHHQPGRDRHELIRRFAGRCAEVDNRDRHGAAGQTDSD